MNFEDYYDFDSAREEYEGHARLYDDLNSNKPDLFRKTVVIDRAVLKRLEKKFVRLLKEEETCRPDAKRLKFLEITDCLFRMCVIRSVLGRFGEGSSAEIPKSD